MRGLAFVASCELFRPVFKAGVVSTSTEALPAMSTSAFATIAAFVQFVRSCRRSLMGVCPLRGGTQRKIEFEARHGKDDSSTAPFPHSTQATRQHGRYWSIMAPPMRHWLGDGDGRVGRTWRHTRGVLRGPPWGKERRTTKKGCHKRLSLVFFLFQAHLRRKGVPWSAIVWFCRRSRSH